MLERHEGVGAMRISCPHCGTRDLREFTCQGAAEALDRPAREADLADWSAYLHDRENPAGETRELWFHGPCGAWIVVERNTVTHAVSGSRLASEGAR